MFQIEYFDEAKKDILNLPINILKEVRDYLDKYQSNPFKYSQELDNKFGLELKGYRKTYVANATYRIVIKIEKNIAKIVEVVAVGERKNKDVYKLAHKRIKNTKH